MQGPLDLAVLYRRVSPWRHALILDGRERRLRRLSNADVAVLLSAGDEDEPAVRSIVAGLFEEADVPAVWAWSTAKVGVVMAAIVAYFEHAVFSPLLPDARAAKPGPAAPKSEWQDVVTLAAKIIPGTPLAELWSMPADATMRIIGGELRARQALTTPPAAPGTSSIRSMDDLRQFQASASGVAGVITEAAEGAAALAQLDRFMLKGGAASKENEGS